MRSLFHPRNSASSWLAILCPKKLDSPIFLVKLPTVFTDRSELVRDLAFIRDRSPASKILKVANYGNSMILTVVPPLDSNTAGSYGKNLQNQGRNWYTPQ